MFGSCAAADGSTGLTAGAVRAASVAVAGGEAEPGPLLFPVGAPVWGSPEPEGEPPGPEAPPPAPPPPWATQATGAIIAPTRAIAIRVDLMDMDVSLSQNCNLYGRRLFLRNDTHCG
jgi:hypothetical protein